MVGNLKEGGSYNYWYFHRTTFPGLEWGSRHSEWGSILRHALIHPLWCNCTWRKLNSCPDLSNIIASWSQALNGWQMYDTMFSQQVANNFVRLTDQSSTALCMQWISNMEKNEPAAANTVWRQIIHLCFGFSKRRLSIQWRVQQGWHPREQEAMGARRLEGEEYRWSVCGPLLWLLPHLYVWSTQKSTRQFTACLPPAKEEWLASKEGVALALQ